MAVVFSENTHSRGGYTQRQHAHTCGGGGSVGGGEE